MTMISPLQNIHSEGSYGNFENKTENELLKISELKNLLIIQIAQYKNSSTKDINIEIENGSFREDLFHRFNVFNINLEPLNRRLEDIPLLTEYFLNNMCANYNIKPFKIKDNNYLLNYNWPGNVRAVSYTHLTLPTICSV